jgi:hypothetical protein
MKSYDVLKKEFEKQVEILRKKCKHKKTDWSFVAWAPGSLFGL